MHIQDFLEALRESEYLKFIEEKRKNEPVFRSCNGLERHHIYLRKYEDGKIDSKENVITLTIADHFLAHILLLQSLEKLGICSEESKTYTIARSTVNMFFKTRWEHLSEEEKEKLKTKIPELSEVRNRTVHAPRTLEARKKASEARKGKVSHFQSLETRKKLSQINLARWTPEYRQKMSEAHRGFKQPKEQIEKRRKSLTGKSHKKFSDEGRKNCSLGHIGKIWMTNGTRSLQIDPKCEFEFTQLGFWRGRPKRKVVKAYAKGKVTVTKDGTTKLVLPECLDEFIQNGWKRGRK